MVLDALVAQLEQLRVAYTITPTRHPAEDWYHTYTATTPGRCALTVVSTYGNGRFSRTRRYDLDLARVVTVSIEIARSPYEGNPPMSPTVWKIRAHTPTATVSPATSDTEASDSLWLSHTNRDDAQRLAQLFVDGAVACGAAPPTTRW